MTGLLQHLAVPDVVWMDTSMDFVEGFPKVGGKSVVLTVVDRLSKYTHFIALGYPYFATSVAKAFLYQVVRLHGVPALIVSDRYPVFSSTIWQELFRLSGTRLRLSSAFQPQMDRQSEVSNCIIMVYLRCLAGDRLHSWLRWLPWVEYCFNTSFQTALKVTPFEVVYGRVPPPLIPFQSGATRVAAVDHQLRDRDAFLAYVQERLLQAQALMKTAHGEKHWLVEFAVGDWVWLHLNNRVAVAVRDGAQSKLSPKFYRPYEVVEKIGAVAYRLQLPARRFIMCSTSRS
jgi:hypothetical protein